MLLGGACVGQMKKIAGLGEFRKCGGDALRDLRGKQVKPERHGDCAAGFLRGPLRNGAPRAGALAPCERRHVGGCGSRLFAGGRGWREGGEFELDLLVLNYPKGTVVQ